ncbi:MAG: PilZ domain-containing protein [Pyrinomonadaceae bacterium]
MSIEQRQFIRFSLDLPAFSFKQNGEAVRTFIQQISIGGCLTEWNEDVFVGENFRIEIVLPNKNRLPLLCKVLYKFEGRGVGAKFLDITRFEQQLIGQIISDSLERDGMPLQVDPFAEPLTFISTDNGNAASLAERRREDEIVEKILSSNK